MSETDPLRPQHHTYVAGQDPDRLAAAAKEIGLEQQTRKQQQQQKVVVTNSISRAQSQFQWLYDDTLTAARMHSVGTLGADERVDQYGTLHLMSIRKRRQTKFQKPKYGELADLFQKHATTAEIEEGEEEQEKEEEEVEEVVDMVEGGTLTAAAFGIVKGTVGPAILYLPRGVFTSGYAVAIPAMIFATVMYIYNAYRLLECWKLESDRNHLRDQRLKEVQTFLQAASNSPKVDKDRPPQYGTAEIQQDAFFTVSSKLLTYPELAERALGPYSVLVRIGIMSFQFGVILTYLIFVPQNLHECVRAMTGLLVPKVYFLIAMIVLEIPLAWIRDIRKLTPTNVMASLLIAFGLASVLTLAVWDGTAPVQDLEGITTGIVFEENLAKLPALTEKWFLFIGTSFFMMEGSITLLVPLQEAVYRPEDKAKFPDLNCTVTSWIVVFYIAFSLTCCAAFGEHIQTALTASLTGKLATVVQLAYSIAVMLTHPLQAFPAMEVAITWLDQAFNTHASSDHNDKGNLQHHIYATLITMVLGVIAFCAIDYLGNVVSILGSLFGIPLALVFPPLMHNSMFPKGPWTTRVVNYCVVVVGFFAMAAASYNTIAQWDEGAEG